MKLEAIEWPIGRKQINDLSWYSQKVVESLEADYDFQQWAGRWVAAKKYRAPAPDTVFSANQYWFVYIEEEDEQAIFYVALRYAPNANVLVSYWSIKDEL